MNVFTALGQNLKYLIVLLLYARKKNGNAANSCIDSKMGRKHAVVLLQLDFGGKYMCILNAKLAYF